MKMRFDWQLEKQPYSYTFRYDITDQTVTPCWTGNDMSDHRAGFSVCAGTLNLELDSDSSIIECWGYLPREGWAASQERFVPEGFPGRIRVSSDSDLVPGVSARIPGLWRPSALIDTSWLQIDSGIADEADIYVRLAEGFVCGLAGAQLVRMWLLVNE